DVDRMMLSALHTPAQLAVAPIMAAAGVFAVQAQKRYTGVVLVSGTGLGMVVLFATSGAPDLALTQILVETVALVTFALVLRRLPARLGHPNAAVSRSPPAVPGFAGGATTAFVAVGAPQPRAAWPTSAHFPAPAYETGHGMNV